MNRIGESESEVETRGKKKGKVRIERAIMDMEYGDFLFKLYVK